MGVQDRLLTKRGWGVGWWGLWLEHGTPTIQLVTHGIIEGERDTVVRLQASAKVNDGYEHHVCFVRDAEQKVCESPCSSFWDSSPCFTRVACRVRGSRKIMHVKTT